MKIETFHPQEQLALQQLSTKVKKVLVTGAGGFLGKAICRRLVAAGVSVVGFARKNYPELSDIGVEMISGDICHPKELNQAIDGCDLVFHVASKTGVWGSKESYYRPNVEGCCNVIAGCLAHNVQKLVYTSTPSVTFAGQDEDGINESAPYAEQYLNFYAETKAQAEQNIIAANGSLLANGDRLDTVSLRPHLIWGPEDPHLVPRVITRAKAGRLRLVGREDKLVDTTYIDNAAYAHILAAITLCSTPERCAGKCYFLSNDEPITMATMLNKILASAALPPVKKRISAQVAYAMGALLEKAYLIMGKQQEPMMTRFVAKQLSTSHYFDISSVKQDLDYRPLINIDKGMQILNLWLTQQSAAPDN